MWWRLVLLFLAFAQPVGVALAQTADDPRWCVTGYVWRDAFRGDYACVRPSDRQQAWNDNAAAASRVAGAGPNCKTGYVWRVARPSDLVCVRPEVRDQVRVQNKYAWSHSIGAQRRPQRIDDY